MSLIRDQQRSNAEVEQPKATHIETVDPTSSPVAPQVTGDSLAVNENPLPTEQFPDASIVEPQPPEQGLINLTPNEQSLQGAGVQAPSDQSIIDLAGRSTGVWQDIAKDYGVDKLNAPEILTTKIPTVYQSLPDESSYRARQLGDAAISSTVDNIKREQAAAAAREQERLSQLNTPNTPQIDKRGSVFGQLFNDLLFGSQQSQKEAEAGRFNPLSLQYGRQGAGVGGWLKYVLGSTVNIPLAVGVEGTELLYGGLRKLGVPEDAAKKFSQAGVLGFLPKAINPTTYFGFDWKKAAQSNQILDALVGESTGDTNDAAGSNKGVYFSRSREPIASTGNAFKDFANIAAQDPVGTAREVIINIFNPLDKPIDDLVGAGLRVLIPKKTPANLTRTVEAQVEAATATKPVLQLPPGKSTSVSVDEQLKKAFGQQAAEAGARAREPQKVLGSSGDIVQSVPPSEVRVELGGGRQVTDTRLVDNQPKLPTSALAPVDNAAQEFAVDLPPVKMEARIEEIPLNQLPGTQPTKAPRILEGTSAVTQRQLPPAVDLSSAGKPLEGYLVRETPSGAAMKIGIGKPSAEGIEIADDIVIAGVDDVSVPKTENLLEAARQLAANKAIIEAPLRQLDELFDSTVDFGRQIVDDVPYRQLTPEAIMDAFTTNARLNLPTDAVKIMESMYPGVGDILKNNDFDSLSDFVARNWIEPGRFIDDLANANNTTLAAPRPVNMTVKPPASMIGQPPPEVYHGTALSNWSPNYNIALYGTRGELGSGLYLTTKPNQAKSYATALVSENISAAVADRSVQPAVYTLRHSFERTIDARKAIPSNSPEVSAMLNGLPPELVKAVKKSVQRDKTITYNGLLTKIEANLVRAGVNPSESVLQDTFRQVSDNLRLLGIDSVYDSKSGFLMALDNTKLTQVSSKAIPAPKTPLQAAVSRYNNDSYAAKFYGERLTTDANLRDSAYKVLSQLNENVDNKLKAVQTEIINRGLDDRDSILPPRQAFTGNPKPTNVDEAFADFPAESFNLCD